MKITKVLNQSLNLPFSDSQKSYFDYDVDLKPAHDCMMLKCKKQWDACPKSEPQARSFHTRDFLEARNLQF